VNSVFKVHSVGAEGNVILRRQPKRRYVMSLFQELPPCLVGITRCAGQAWPARGQSLSSSTSKTHAILQFEGNLDRVSNF
jgi:hypothetical protein